MVYTFSASEPEGMIYYSSLFHEGCKRLKAGLWTGEVGVTEVLFSMVVNGQGERRPLPTRFTPNYSSTIPSPGLQPRLTCRLLWLSSTHLWLLCAGLLPGRRFPGSGR